MPAGVWFDVRGELNSLRIMRAKEEKAGLW